jgi:hypothetical protein
MNFRFQEFLKIGQRLPVFFIIALAVGFAGFQPVVAGAGENVTVQAQDRGLGDVLDEISKTAGYQFIMDKEWEDYSVTANLNNVPIDVALKRLLHSLNSAVIFGADDTIKIMIYGEESKTRNSNTARPYKPPPPPKVIPPPIPAPSMERSEEADEVPGEEELEEEELEEDELDDEEELEEEELEEDEPEVDELEPGEEDPDPEEIKKQIKQRQLQQKS